MLYICMVWAKTKQTPYRAGLAQSACGGDVRPEAILAASMKQEPTVSAAYHRSAGILFLQGEEEVKRLIELVQQLRCACKSVFRCFGQALR